MLTKVFYTILFTLTFSFAFGQKTYDLKWKEVQAKTKKGDFKSTLPLIIEIQKMAMKENNTVQLIRSLKAEFSIVNQTYDDTQNNESSVFFKKLQNASKDLKGDDALVFDVLLGEFFQDYFSENYWEIQGRTNLNNQDLTQIETWSRLDFKNYLLKHYKSLNDKNAQLRNVKIKDYKAIFTSTQDLEFFPSLADWAANNEITFLTNSNYFTKNELEDNHQTILKIYDQQISGNTLNSKLYYQHKKLNYLCTYSSCKDLLPQLEQLYLSTEKGDYKVLIAQNIIELYLDKGDSKKALNFINKVRTDFPKSKFLSNLKSQENSILQPILTVNFESETLANKPIHLVARGKNVDQFSLNIYKVNDDFENYLKFKDRSYDSKLFQKVKKNLVRKESFTLPKSDDFKLHSTSLEIKALPAAIYMVEYVVNGEITEMYSFIASNSRVIYQNKNEEKFEGSIFKLVDRNTGKNLENSEVEVFEFNSDLKLTKTLAQTSKDGSFSFPKSLSNNYYRTYIIKETKNNNIDIMSIYGNNRVLQPTNDTKFNTQIFLDRAIYRPGQTVYFKVINTKLADDKESIASGLKQTITLKDTNRQEVSSQVFTSGEFGSYHGSFTLPQGKLNGQFTINVKGLSENVNKSFKVEEYKRPKFEVTFEPIKDEYKYGETIEIKGKASMFSGVALSDATVKYEIKKQNIRWRYFSWYPRGNDNENSILGEVKTNDKGEFTIQLDLKKDENLEGLQIDNFEINASVTDISGETQSNSDNIKVSSVSHYITLETVEDLFSDEDVKLKVFTKNYNDQLLEKSFNLKLVKLKSVDRVIRNNFKDAVQDLPVFSKSEFVQKFPHDYFSVDEKKELVEKVVFESLEQPTKNSLQATAVVDLGKLNAGKYKLELYNIEGKDTIKTEKTFEVFSKKFLVDTQKPFLKVLHPTEEVDRNKKVELFIYSAIPNALVNIFVQDGKNPQKLEQKTLKQGLLKYEIALPADESIENLNVQVQLVALNDVQTENFNLKIKSEKTNLTIETTTFRDKLEPGKKEKWVLKISGDGKERLNAEVLANMYDQSLDQFAANSYNWRSLKQNYFQFNNYTIYEGLETQSYSKRFPYVNYININTPQFQWFDNDFLYGNVEMTLEGKVSGLEVQRESKAMATQEGFKTASYSPPPPVSTSEIYDAVEEIDENGYVIKINGVSVTPRKKVVDKNEKLETIKVRQNLNETAFFYPELKTDKDGNVEFEFTSPEALTQWKVMFLAHTKDAQSAYLQKSVVTQKEFSVTPNYPRFLREGDELNFQSKLSSLVDKPLNGTAQLQILDAFTNEDISSKFNLINAQKSFNLKENGNSVVNWTVKVPLNVESIILKVVAKAGDFSDGEQKSIAVLPNRILVTDAVPIFVKDGETKTFVLDALLNNTSTTTQNVTNTLELTTNPIWEIMFALPSLKNETNLSADVVFNKWFADVLASEIFKANPKLKTVFEEYQSKGLLVSKLEKNQELKQLLLEETPWVLDAKNETEQMEKLARLFDANTMRNSINEDWTELVKLQNPDGGFSWYSGYPSSYSSSLYILKNLGRINEWLKDNIKDYQSSEQKTLVQKLVNYVDDEMDRYHNVKDKLLWTNYNLDYLDTRHYWEKEFPLKGKSLALKNLVKEKAKIASIKDFTFFGLHRSALLFHNYGLTSVSDKLLNYLKETSTDTKTQGVYWKQNFNDWGWFGSKVVNHAGALEAFNKLKPTDSKFIEEMKIWLITQKNVNSWGTSRGTAEVIFTILNSGKSWTTNESDKAKIIWGGKELDNPNTKATGYVKTTFKGDQINKDLATVTITKPGAGIVQGGLFWQYFEDIDKVKSSENYISITKELYKKIKTVNGEELIKISDNSPLKVGDRVTVRMILNTDRPMELIHLKDMRAAGFEPVNVISSYEWKNGLGYYQSTKDASTNFYIEQMPKGKYVFEYDYICNASGMFSNGISTLQNYYAPEMNARSEGTKITIAE